jgi:molybdate transport system permease protein
MQSYLTDSRILASLFLTLKIIIYSVPILFLIGILVGYISCCGNRIISEILEVITTLPMIFPPIGLGFLMLYFFGKNGFFGRILPENLSLIFNFRGLLVATVITGLPFMAKSVKSGIKNDIIGLCEAAYTLGKSELETFIFIVIPSIKLNIISGLILATGRILGEVGITLMIGGNIAGKTNTISLEIYNSVLDGEYERAIFLSVVLGIFSFIIFIFIRTFNRDY